ncbi:fibronectin type III domain-containing protein [Sinomonas atrocyanea]
MPLTASDQILEYTVTDVDGLTDTAFIWVPGADLQRPHLAKEDITEVKAGTSVDFDLKDWVTVRDGHTPRITSVDRVSAVGAAARGLVASDSVLHYAALPDFVGPGSITFEVTDGSGPDDPTGLKSTITLQTKVLPSDANHPPAFQGSTVDVPVGEDARIDLGQLAKDPDPADQGHLAFAVRGAAPDGFTASVDGSTLTVRTRDGVLAGRTGSLTVTVTDGHSDPVAAQFTLTATASDRPLAIANDVLVPDADAGRTERVDVLSHTVDPFPDAPLTIVSAVVEAGQAEGGAQVDGGSVIVTPAKDYRGMLVVRYTVQDKTGDPSRQVDGRIRITVRGVPDAPGAPTATDIRDQTAVLHWTPAADNGAPILKYTVRGNGFSQDCPATTCTLSGLTNNTVYHFTVTATNDVGESAPSSASPEVRPDARPSAPGAPVAVFGDGKLDISWGAAKSTGSPVTSYNLEISPPPANGAPGKQGVTGTSTTWTGLTNGVQYTVRVQAVNNAPQPSDWSPYSAPVSPAAPPGQPAAPVAQSAPSLGSTAQVSVSWQEPVTNGDAISAYYVTMSGGGGADRTQKVAGTSTTATFDAPTSQTPYTFTVQAENKAGKGSVSPPSAPRRAVGKLGSVTNVTATPANTGGTGTQLTVNFTPSRRASATVRRPTRSATPTRPPRASPGRSPRGRPWADSRTGPPRRSQSSPTPARALRTPTRPAPRRRGPTDRPGPPRRRARTGRRTSVRSP